ncbi:MAG: hypothetical protein K9W43_06675 [Candidatus Thorarchaeota archaeon]|nr:hypothetical protein [Candidatus Thorarchaeota archaeon]
MDKIVRNLSVLSAIAAVLGIVSGYGSTCPTLDPPTDPTSKLYIMHTLQPVFIITTALTWAVGIAWILLIWAIISRKAWFYTSAVLVSLVGALSGFIPAILVMINGMPFSPSLLRAFLNLFILIYLVLPFKAPTIKAVFTASSTVTTGITSSIVMYMLIAIGIVLMLQPIVVPWTHVIDGVYEYGLEALQFFGGLFSVLLAGSIKLSERIHATHLLKLGRATEIPHDETITQ